MCDEQCVELNFEAEYHETLRIANDLRAENTELKAMVDNLKMTVEGDKEHIANMKLDLNRLSGMVEAFKFIVTKGRKQNDE